MQWGTTHEVNRVSPPTIALQDQVQEREWLRSAYIKGSIDASTDYGKTVRTFKYNGSMTFRIPTSWAPIAVWAPLFYLGTIALIINKKTTEDLADT